MLDSARKYKNELKNKLIDTWYDEKYKFYNNFTYNSELNITEDDWNSREFVSLDNNGDILGYINYGINRTSDLVPYLGIVNFSNNKIIFAKDLNQVVDDIFCKFNMRKLEFTVVVGNPIEKTYDKLIKKYGGNIVGVKHKNCKLIDNKYYDEKIYEIFREDYIKNRYGKIL